MSKKIYIGVNDPETAAEAWRRAGRGERFSTENLLHFETLDVLLKTLTPARWRQLKSLRRQGPMSIRLLAKALKRDYKNTHTDVKQLIQIGLIEKRTDGRIQVLWDIVEARLHLPT
jgi:predicted transcriptional regulator